MSNSPVAKPRRVQKDRLSGEFYLASLLGQAYETGLIGESEADRIQRETLYLLERQTNRYTGGESSSVKVETAQMLLQSVLYTAGLYLKSYPDPEAAVAVLLDQGADWVYSRGRERADDMLKDSRRLLAKVKSSSFLTKNQAYQDTVGQGLDSFFSAYDADFAAHETACLIDYPISRDVEGIVGIEYMETYLSRLLIENQFCQNFAPDAVDRVMEGCSAGYEDLLINIFDQVLARALGCILSYREAKTLEMEPYDLLILQKKWGAASLAELEGELKRAAEELFQIFSVTDQDVQSYIVSAAGSMAPRVANALTNNSLEAVFCLAGESFKNPAVSFEDGQPMEDEAFRNFADELRSCRYGADKAEMIRQKVRSLSDLVDILEGDCLFEDEWNDVYGMLGDWELALLWQKVSGNDEDSNIHLSEGQKEWRQRLSIFLEKANPRTRRRIGELAGNIQAD